MIALSYIFDFFTIFASVKSIDLDEKYKIFITFAFNTANDFFKQRLIDEINYVKKTFLFYFRNIF